MRQIIVAADEEDMRTKLTELVRTKLGVEPHVEKDLGYLISEVEERWKTYMENEGKIQGEEKAFYGLAIFYAHQWNRIPESTTTALKSFKNGLEVCVVGEIEDSRKAVLEAGAEHFLVNDKYLEQRLGDVLTGYMERTYQGKP
jgi:hypothetical protein